jgi:hypothetical protein
MRFIELTNFLLDSHALGLIEDILIPGIGKLKAKTDTGNEAHNVLHGTDIKISGKVVYFKCPNGNNVSFPLKDIVKIHIGGGNIDKRPVIACDCVVNNKKYSNVLFSITDRTSNTYKVLLGQDFIKLNGGLVNVTKED